MTHAERPTTVKDPVCGMAVDTATAKHVAAYRGEPFFFCSLMCKKAFEDDPLHYLTEGRHGTPGTEEG